MRIVADTNVLVSALLWSGAPHRILRAAENGAVVLYTSPALLEELRGVLARPKFACRLADRGITRDEVLGGVARLAHIVMPAPIPPLIVDDADDDAVVACALAARAAYLVSGDPHLLNVKRYQSIHIVSPRAFLTDVLHVSD